MRTIQLVVNYIFVYTLLVLAIIFVAYNVHPTDLTGPGIVVNRIDDSNVWRLNPSLHNY